MSMRIGYGWDSHAFKPGRAADPHRRPGRSSTTPASPATPMATFCCTASPTLCSAPSPGRRYRHLLPAQTTRWKNADSSIFLEDRTRRGRHRRLSHRQRGYSAHPDGAQRSLPIANEIRERVARAAPGSQTRRCRHQGQDARRPYAGQYRGGALHSAAGIHQRGEWPGEHDRRGRSRRQQPGPRWIPS